MSEADKKTSKNELTLKSVAVDCATMTATHPITLIKTLIQLGHEPLAPYTGRTWTFAKQQFLPGALPYGHFIVKQDGFCGLFRGLTPRLGSSLTFSLANRFIGDQLSKHANICPEEATVEDSWEEGFKKVGQKIVHKSIVESLAVVLSYPLNVLAIRSMAQFISREDAYDSLIGGTEEIFTQEGWSGFFSGITPKLVGVILGITLIEAASFAIKKQINQVDEEVKKDNQDLFSLLNQHASLFAGVIANTFTYPYTLASTIMSVNGSRLSCASGHDNWNTCLKELKESKMHHRGSTIFFGRKYKEVVVKIAAYAFCVAETAQNFDKKCSINC